MRAEQNSQLEALRGAIGEVEKKQQHEHEKVSELQEAVGDVPRQMSQTEEAFERAALGLAETKDLTSRVESDLAGLQEATAEGSAKVEEVRREVAGLGLPPKVKHELANLERELATLKEEMRELRRLKAAMADQRQRREQEIRDMKHGVELLRQTSEREAQEREMQAVADVQKVAGQLAGDLVTLPSENGREHLVIAEVARANGQLRAD